MIPDSIVNWSLEICYWLSVSRLTGPRIGGKEPGSPAFAKASPFAKPTGDGTGDAMAGRPARGA
jgi:hypothetical protein